MSRAMELGSQLGLDGLTIGSLAERLALSKSGLFAHFRSKEALQIQVLDLAVEKYTQLVVKPALQAPRGEPRIRAFFERWLVWGTSSVSPGGCLFVAASIEFDDRPGPVRDHLVKIQKDGVQLRVRLFKTAIDEGHLGPEADPEQLAHDLFSIMLGCHYAARLLKDPKAEERARKAFESLLENTKKQ